jgi:apolipoprotein D and lipocalin family protein
MGHKRFGGFSRLIPDRSFGMNRYIALLMVLLLAGCYSTPQGVQPVESFDLNRYLGKWYEIARLDHSFERGLEQVTAEYSLRDDGGITVINRGFSQEDNEWSQAEGKAYFVGDKGTGHLKVSFFGPFYSSYVIFGLDEENYEYAFVSGPRLSYLWLLSRKPTVSEEVMKEFLEKAGSLGFETEKLIYVRQEPD